MDLKSINPTPPEPRDAPSKPTKVDSESVRDGQGLISELASHASENATPAPGSAVDRVELTEQLQQRLREFREALNKEKSLKKEKIEELRVEINESTAVTRAKLLLAADGILKGELFYANSSGR